MHQRDFGGEVGQEQRLLYRCIAPTDNHHFLAPVKEPVAGRAGGHAHALELLLGWQAKPARLRAGRQHHRIGRVDRAAIAQRAERGAPTGPATQYAR